MSAPPASGALLWAAVVLAAGISGPLLPWPVAALALGAALGAALLRGARREALAAGLVALGGAPWWGALLGEQAGGPERALAAASGIVLLLTCQPILPRALPLVLLGVGALEATRQAVVSLALPAAWAGAGALLLVAVGLAGQTAAARRAPACLGALVVVGLVGLGRAGLAVRQPPQDAAAVARAAELGVLRWQAGALLAQPDLALEALRADPTLHGLAMGLLPTLGPNALLAADWRAEQAPLDAHQRLVVARALDAAGEGGRAIRVLRPGRADPEVAWRLTLLERQTGRAGPWQGEAPPSLRAQPPERWRLPGRVELQWVFLTDGAKVVELHATEAVGALTLLASGDALDGPAILEARLDHAAPVELRLPSEPTELPVADALTPGPHRLELRFVNDAVSATGDRNARALALIGAPLSP